MLSSDSNENDWAKGLYVRASIHNAMTKLPEKETRERWVGMLTENYGKCYFQHFKSLEFDISG